MNVYQFVRDRDMTCIDGAHNYYLPRVKCGCDPNSGGDGDYAFPAFSFDAANRAFADEHRTMSPEELQTLRDSILQTVGRQVWMPPGSSLGPYVGTSHTTKLTDFVDGGQILVSKRAIEVLHNAGIDLLTGPAQVRCRGTLLDTHLVLHVEPTVEPTLAPSTAQALTLQYCPRCGCARKRDLRAAVRVGDYQVRRDCIPGSPTLFRLYEWSSVLATEAFVEVLSSLSLTGATFKVWGTVV